MAEARDVIRPAERAEWSRVRTGDAISKWGHEDRSGLPLRWGPKWGRHK